MPTKPFVNRDGTASLRELAQKMCLLVNTFEPIMRQNYGTDPLFLAILATAQTACTLVPRLDELRAAFEPPSGDVLPPGETPGINPDRPAPPAPPA